jgi:hypothetical protein
MSRKQRNYNRPQNHRQPSPNEAHPLIPIIPVFCQFRSIVPDLLIIKLISTFPPVTSSEERKGMNRKDGVCSKFRKRGAVN